MIKNYFRVAIRSLLKKPAYSLVNIFGLAVGFTCCLLIMLYVQYEQSFDNFQKEGDQIYRMALKRIYPGRSTDYAFVPHSIGPQLVEDFPEVLNQTRIVPPFGSTVFQYEDQFFDEQRFVLADSLMFEVLDVPLKVGDPETALDNPSSVIMSETTAKRYFGDDDPIGKVIETNGLKLEVTGIAYDYPENSHLEFDMIGSMNSIPFFRQDNWLTFSAMLYVKLADGTDPKSLEQKFPAFIRKYAEGNVQRRVGMSYDDYIAAGNGYEYTLDNIRDIHLYSNREGEIKNNGSATYVFVFTAIAIFILVIACINFMNLATARSTERAKEVGIRKVLGSLKAQLITQFLTESVILSVASVAISLGLIFLLLPKFNLLAERPISFEMLFSAQNIGMIGAIMIGVGLLAGIYPAFVLSAFKPVSVLKGKMQTARSGRTLRNGLVVLQFAISIFLISCTLIIYNQMNYMTNKDLGFTKDQVVVIENAAVLADSRESYRQFAMTQNGVKMAGNTTAMPGGFYAGFVMKVENTEEDTYVSRQLSIDDYFLETMDIEIIQGRNFSKEFNDSLNIILNKSLVDKLNIEDPIGRKLTEVNEPPQVSREFTIIGVVDDFHYQSLHREIEPLVILHADAGFGGNFMPVKFASGNSRDLLTSLENKWNEMAPGNPFKYHFVDERLAQFYGDERTSSNIFTIFSLLAILIGCIGLLGLSAYTASQKTKEIGVRKVLGASVSSIVMLLSKDFVKLIAIAIVVAGPTAYFWSDNWLQNFAYSITPNVFVFVGAGLLALLIGLAVVGYQGLRSALINPVDSLKDE